MQITVIRYLRRLSLFVDTRNWYVGVRSSQSRYDSFVSQSKLRRCCLRRGKIAAAICSFCQNRRSSPLLCSGNLCAPPKVENFWSATAFRVLQTYGSRARKETLAIFEEDRDYIQPTSFNRTFTAVANGSGNVGFRKGLGTCVQSGQFRDVEMQNRQPCDRLLLFSGCKIRQKCRNLKRGVKSEAVYFHGSADFQDAQLQAQNEV